MMEKFFIDTDRECSEKMHKPRSVDEIIADARNRCVDQPNKNGSATDGKEEFIIDKHNTP